MATWASSVDRFVRLKRESGFRVGRLVGFAVFGRLAGAGGLGVHFCLTNVRVDRESFIEGRSKHGESLFAEDGGRFLEIGVRRIGNRSGCVNFPAAEFCVEPPGPAVEDHHANVLRIVMVSPIPDVQEVECCDESLDLVSGDRDPAENPVCEVTVASISQFALFEPPGVPALEAAFLAKFE